jgi:hypothetical protein
MQKIGDAVYVLLSDAPTLPSNFAMETRQHILSAVVELYVILRCIQMLSVVQQCFKVNYT